MAYKIPNAKKNDVVERADFSRMFGRVKNVKGSYAEVEWNDDEKPKMTKEKINDLALIERNKFIK
jgi:hypothetical protein